MGRVATFEDKLYVLRIFGNFIMSHLIESYSDASELTAIALQMGNKTVARIVREQYFSNKDGDIYSVAEGDASRRGTWQFSVPLRAYKNKKEMLLWCHSMVMTKLQDGEKL